MIIITDGASLTTVTCERAVRWLLIDWLFGAVRREGDHRSVCEILETST